MEKIIHQIWVGPYEMPNREKDFVERMKLMNPDWDHILWTDENLPELPDAIKRRCNMFFSQKDYVHAADVLRVFLVNKFGGIYLDVDFNPVSPLSQSGITEHEAVFFCHGGEDYTMPNQCFGSSKNSEISEYLLSQISSDFGGWYGPSWLGETVKKYIKVPYETDHGTVGEKLKEKNIGYMSYSELEEKYCKHKSLYSWSPENKRNFEEGNINYSE
jgi:mannosyltransferase OCH1-like enzyme